MSQEMSATVARVSASLAKLNKRCVMTQVFWGMCPHGHYITYTLGEEIHDVGAYRDIP